MVLHWPYGRGIVGPRLLTEKKRGYDGPLFNLSKSELIFFIYLFLKNTINFKTIIDNFILLIKWFRFRFGLQCLSMTPG